MKLKARPPTRPSISNVPFFFTVARPNDDAMAAMLSESVGSAMSRSDAMSAGAGAIFEDQPSARPGAARTGHDQSLDVVTSDVHGRDGEFTLQ